MGKVFDILNQIDERIKKDKRCTLNLEALKQRIPDADTKNAIIRFLKKQGYKLEYLEKDHQLRIEGNGKENNNEIKETVSEGIQQYFQRSTVDRDLYRLL